MTSHLTSTNHHAFITTSASIGNDSIAILLGLTILTVCLQLHVCICVGVYNVLERNFYIAGQKLS